MENSPKWRNTTQSGYFPNRDDALTLASDSRRHFGIQDGGFRFLENSPKWTNTIHYGYFWNRNDAQRPKIDLENSPKWRYEYFRNWDDAQRLEIDYKRYFEIQDLNFRFLENSLK